MSKHLKVLIIGKVWPEPASSASGARTMQLISLFQEFNNSSSDQLPCKIHFATAADYSQYAENLSVLRPEVSFSKIKLNHSSFDEFLKEYQPNIVVFDRFMTEEQYSHRVIEVCPDALRILDTHDLHFLRNARKNIYKKANQQLKSDSFSIPNLQEDYPEEIISEYAKRELVSILRSDLNLIISQAECEFLENIGIQKNTLMYLPLLYKKDLLQLQKIANEQREKSHNCNGRTLDNRKDFIFIGNFLHEPNLDAVIFLRNEIWPEIRKRLPSATLNIYGAYPSQQILNLESKKIGFNVCGRAGNLSEIFLNAKINLAPLLYGAGLKGKIVDSLFYNLPFVTTPIGAEGFDFQECTNNNLITNNCVTHNKNEFIEKAVELYSNETVYKNIQAEYSLILEKNFLYENFENIFRKEILNFLKNLSLFRTKNIYSSILITQQFLSSRYFSRWIEGKER